MSSSETYVRELDGKERGREGELEGIYPICCNVAPSKPRGGLLAVLPSKRVIDREDGFNREDTVSHGLTRGTASAKLFCFVSIHVVLVV